mmetsp:Transcript_26371/g.79236  ORF Transcript_26371/g.79236 Transcript_26371/m.79236 type:complete len:527 (+) Transcript_26371:330-1910(+)
MRLPASDRLTKCALSRSILARPSSPGDSIPLRPRLSRISRHTVPFIPVANALQPSEPIKLPFKSSRRSDELPPTALPTASAPSVEIQLSASASSTSLSLTSSIAAMPTAPSHMISLPDSRSALRVEFSISALPSATAPAALTRLPERSSTLRRVLRLSASASPWAPSMSMALPSRDSSSSTVLAPRPSASERTARSEMLFFDRSSLASVWLYARDHAITSTSVLLVVSRRLTFTNTSGSKRSTLASSSNTRGGQLSSPAIASSLAKYEYCVAAWHHRISGCVYRLPTTSRTTGSRKVHRPAYDVSMGRTNEKRDCHGVDLTPVSIPHSSASSSSSMPVLEKKMRRRADRMKEGWNTDFARFSASVNWRWTRLVMSKLVGEFSTMFGRWKKFQCIMSSSAHRRTKSGSCTGGFMHRTVGACRPVASASLRRALSVRRDTFFAGLTLWMEILFGSSMGFSRSCANDARSCPGGGRCSGASCDTADQPSTGGTRDSRPWFELRNKMWPMLLVLMSTSPRNHRPLCEKIL